LKKTNKNNGIQSWHGSRNVLAIVEQSVVINNNGSY